jgi:hypothetical protein
LISRKEVDAYMNLRKFLVCICGLVISFAGISQVLDKGGKMAGIQTNVEFSSPSNEIEIEWEPTVSQVRFDGESQKRLSFSGAVIDPSNNLPHYRSVRRVSNNLDSISVSLTPLEVQEFPDIDKSVDISDLGADYQVRSSIRKSGNINYAIIEFFPIRNKSGKVERLNRVELTYEYFESSQRGSGRDNEWKESSVLSTGEWYEIRTGEDAIYKLTYSFLQSCGFNLAGLPSSSIRLFGTKSGELSHSNDAWRPDDLTELSIYIDDQGDGTFDPGDNVLFHGEDQLTWRVQNERFAHSKNNYSDSSSYFLTINGGTGSPKRISKYVTQGDRTRMSSTYDFYDLYEVNSTNLIKSGRTWYGEQLGLVPSYDFGFSVPDIDRGSNAFVKARFALRSVSISGNGMTLSLPNQGGLSATETVGAVSSSYASQYAISNIVSLDFKPTGSDFLTMVSIENSKNPNAQGWLDYVELNARRELSFIGPSMQFRDSKSSGLNNRTEFQVQSTEADLHIWDITAINDVVEMTISGSVSNGFKFLAETDSLKEFVIFTESGIKAPTKVGSVQNQDLHGLGNVEYLVITHPSFRVYAEQLADMHEEIDGFSTAVVDVDDIYNEFSGGSQDISAIKEFVRMLYFRSQGSGKELKYLLLFGDGSYDYLNRISGNSNFVPCHQTMESLIPTASVVSDDFYGLLDIDEGDSPVDLIDIGIGRLPARTKSEAEQMVNKIKYYTESKKTFGDWRNSVTLVADDPESRNDEFQRQTSTLGSLADSLSPEFNIHKIYLDAFKQVAGSGGERYPDASKAIDGRIRKGTLLMYYIGHGGELGWAHERVLEVPSINKWENLNSLPLFITATCEFTRYDDPRRTSAGEYVMLNPSGGGVALLTTTRAVYSGPNFDLTYSFTRQAFESLSQEKPRLGDMIKQTKIENASTGAAGFNTRCFALLGDPAMRLAFPQENIIVTQIPDTIKALDKVKIKGAIVDKDSNVLTSFNGLVYPTLYDKEVRIQGQNNDGEGVFFYEERRNVLFKGKSTATNGLFEFEFVVPKDINREYGEGKLSLYADNGSYDASGAEYDFIIGGLSDNPVNDEVGPEVNLYMNNDKFVFGGMTNEEPDLFAVVRDENGINMVGTGIGHDITAVLDENGANTIVLNDFYEADVDSYQSGKIRYPFQDLDEGRHTLKLQVWDVNNNPSDAYTEFVVANDEQFALDHILNYPNPFTTNTDFYFEHNKPGLSLDVRIDVFTVSGKLVKTKRGQYLNDGFRVGPINWNGRDDFGDVLAKGVYLYKITVKTPLGEQVEEFEKLVILK